MQYPERFSNLPAHVWPRLRALLDAHDSGAAPIHMTIGEPKHAFPKWVNDVIIKNSQGFNKYPVNEGIPELRLAITQWISRRYGVDYDPNTEVMALNGTREGLYNAVMALCPEHKNGARPAIAMPNPFYPVYLIGTISGQADPILVNATAETGHLPDFAALSDDVLDRLTAAFVCSPANPQGAVADRAYWKALLTLAEKHDFLIFADECYSEIYRDTPPPGALEIANEMGVDRNRVVAFHSLSKRSNLPGLRAGFVASGAQSMAQIRQLRAYSGAPLPEPLQHAAAAVWDDEAHVIENRALYAEKYALADRILGNIPGYVSPQAGFFLWLPVEDGETAALKLWRETGVRVLPGAYLAQDKDGKNPATGYIRVALVADKKETEQGLTAIRNCLYGN